MMKRRSFLKQSALGLLGAGIAFPNISIVRKKEKLGVALVGLGGYSRGLLAPGLQLTQHCELRGIVTGSPHKIPDWQKQYGIPDVNVYSYETMRELANNPNIDIVYIVVPTGLHAKYAIIAANAGKNVYCEKPMAMNIVECGSILDAAIKNGVFLSIGYRMQHEPNTQQIIRMAKEKPFGSITSINIGAGYVGSYPKGNWRLNASLGGGALYDMGVYPINAARYASGMEPIAVTGKQIRTRTEMFTEVDETTEFTLEFSNGLIVQGETSVGQSQNYLDVTCERGWYRLRPFQSYRGVKGEASDGRVFPADPHHQQARQMDNDALAIINKKTPLVSGEDGLADVRIVEAIMESSKKDRQRIAL